MALEKQKALYIEAFEGHEKLHHPFDKDTIKMVGPPISLAIHKVLKTYYNQFMLN